MQKKIPNGAKPAAGKVSAKPLPKLAVQPLTKTKSIMAKPKTAAQKAFMNDPYKKLAKKHGFQYGP